MNGPISIEAARERLCAAVEKSVEAEVASNLGNALSKLRNLSGPSNLKRMKDLMTDSTYVIPMMIPTGALTVIAAHPNSAKTLAIFSLLVQEVKAGRLRGEDVFFINEDDNLRGLVEKTEIAQEHGINMMSSIQTDDEDVRNTTQMVDLILQVAEAEEASGKVFIFDTYKKFTAPMNVGQNTEFHKNLRRITAMGGTVILLHHGNKHLTDEGSLVMKGTQDIMDDVDIVYYLYPRAEKDDEQQIVEFICAKDRGHVEQQFRFQYRKAMDIGYREMLDSFEPVDDQEWSRIAAVEIRERFLASIADDRETIRQMLGSSTKSGAELESLRQAELVEISKNRLESLPRIMAKVGILKGSRGANNSRLYSVNDDWSISQYDWFELPEQWR